MAHNAEQTELSSAILCVRSVDEWLFSETRSTKPIACNANSTRWIAVPRRLLTPVSSSPSFDAQPMKWRSDTHAFICTLSSDSAAGLYVDRRLTASTCQDTRPPNMAIEFPCLSSMPSIPTEEPTANQLVEVAIKRHESLRRSFPSFS